MTDTPNTLFPGLPGYTGPTKGWFSLLHHAGGLVEWSDNVMERVDYINRNKPKSEINTRLRHIVYLGGRGDDYEAKRKPLYDEIIAYIRPMIQDFAWDGKQLRFPE